LFEELARANSYALRILAFQPRTVHELRTRLKGKGFSEETVQTVMECMVGYGYIDDYQYASQWIKLRLGKRGLWGLKTELAGKGIDIFIINSVLQQLDIDDEYQAALRIIKKKTDIKQFKSANSMSLFLQRRGYSAGVILKLCRDFYDKNLEP